MKLTSIMIKVLMALTGLAWFGFLIGHLSGNFLLYKGPEAFDAYGRGLHALAGGALVTVAEIGLIVFFLVHMVSGIRTAKQNREARKNGYAVSGRLQTTLAQKTMLVGGVIIAIFVVLHIWQFRLQWDPQSGESLWALTVRTFKESPLVTIFYVVAMGFLGMHLSHGFGSAFQTLGIFKPHWRLGLRKFGHAFGWLIAVGFAAMPIWAFFVAKV